MSESPKQKKGFFSRILDFIDGFRRVVINLLFLVFLGFFIFTIYTAYNSSKGVLQPESAALVLAPQGVVVDQLAYVDPVSHLAGPSPIAETLLSDLIEAVDKAKDDQQIKMLVLWLDDLEHIGISKAGELGAAIDRFKTSKKPVVAVGELLDQDSYYLAAYADEIIIHPMGGVAIEGFSVYRNYYKTALEKLSIDFHVFKVGDFKSAMEPFIRDDMSAEAKAANKAWLEQLWRQYTVDIAKRRKILVTDFSRYINDIDQVLAAEGGSAAKAALSNGLVDKVLTDPEMRDALIAHVGADEENNFNQVFYRDYLRRDRLAELTSPKIDKPSVGLIVARGNIMTGDQPTGVIGSDNLKRLIRDAAADKNIKALVLRIDSGGGSAFASEVIRNELNLLQAAGKPLVVSMGSVAASGGYWIAAAADEIWATSSTLTGSIGIFGAFPTFDRSLEKLGVGTDGIGTTDLAGSLRVDRPVNPIAAAALQQNLEYGYSQFLSIVASGRDMLPEQVDKIAQGRVWSGKDAQEIGLVDKLGSLEAAIESAAQLAELTDYGVETLKEPLPPGAELLRLFMDQVGFITPQIKMPSALDSLLQPYAQTIKSLEQMNDPRGIYLQCTACSSL